MNPNLQATFLLVESLRKAGLTDVVVCPGSRSTPLTLAFAAAPEIKHHLCLDERSGAFLALGIALTHDRPVAILCTSGTAAANFYPAIIEAHMSQVPLIILTADRPHELRHSGANQTIDQVKLFGDQVLWGVDMALPEAHGPAVAWRNVVTTARRAYRLANGALDHKRKGVVHLNLPFRKPLEPQETNWRPEIERWAAPFLPKETTPKIDTLATGMPTRQTAEQFTMWLNHFERGIIVCGPRCPGGDFPQVVASLATAAGYPIFADPLSGLRFGPHLATAPIISGYEGLLAGNTDPDWEPPDIIIRFGQVPTSKWLNNWLGRIEPQVRLHVRENGVWADDSHLTEHFWPVDETALCQMGQSMIGRGQLGQPDTTWQDQVAAWDQGYWQQTGIKLQENDFDAAYLFDIVKRLAGQREPVNLMIGNSLPVRHLDQFGQASAAPLTVYGNRGASGIDGVVSTACGIATAEPSMPTVLIIGDVSLYHDMNGLLAARELPNLLIILFNNNSGSIFRRLPIAPHDPPFTPLFLTPHNLDFSHAAALYGLDFVRVDTRVANSASRTDMRTHITSAMAEGLSPDRPWLIEIVTDGEEDETLRKALASAQ